MKKISWILLNVLVVLILSSPGLTWLILHWVTIEIPPIKNRFFELNNGKSFHISYLQLIELGANLKTNHFTYIYKPWHKYMLYSFSLIFSVVGNIMYIYSMIKFKVHLKASGAQTEKILNKIFKEK